MAIGIPVQRKSIAETAQTATTIENPTTTIGSGNLAVALVQSGQSKIVSSVADSVGGNTWHVDVTGNGGSGTHYLSVVSCQIFTPITSSDSITFTWDSANSAACDIWIYEIAFAATTSAFDKSAIANGTTVAVNSGNTAPLSQADEVVFGLCNIAAAGRTFTKGASYSESANPLRGTTTEAMYKIVTDTSAVAADGTWSGADGTATVTGVFTYKGLSIIPPALSPPTIHGWGAA